MANSKQLHKQNANMIVVVCAFLFVVNVGVLGLTPYTCGGTPPHMIVTQGGPTAKQCNVLPLVQRNGALQLECEYYYRRFAVARDQASAILLGNLVGHGANFSQNQYVDPDCSGWNDDCRYMVLMNCEQYIHLLNLFVNDQTLSPTGTPSGTPTRTPTSSPTTPFPTLVPSLTPSLSPSVSPTLSNPTSSPTINPSVAPTTLPTRLPSTVPTQAPTSKAPSKSPTSTAPSKAPWISPTTPSSAPTSQPSTTVATLPPTIPPTALTLSTTSSSSQSDNLPWIIVGVVAGLFVVIIIIVVMCCRHSRPKASPVAITIVKRTAADEYDATQGLYENPEFEMSSTQQHKNNDVTLNPSDVFYEVIPDEQNNNNNNNNNNSNHAVYETAAAGDVRMYDSVSTFKAVDDDDEATTETVYDLASDTDISC